jgi:hypothetical protein
MGIFVAFAAIGCAEESKVETKSASYAAYDMAGAAPAAAAMPPAPSERAAAPGGTMGAPVPPAMPRKIIYNAQVTLVVESVGSLEQELEKLCTESGGYIAEKTISGSAHEKRQGTWKVRIPSDRFNAFLASVGRLGEMQQNHIDSQDVTQEYYDLEARISNKQQEEKRLQKHLDDSTGKLEDILAVERELSRVRGEVEQMQGRLRYLANQTDLSTVTISASELVDYTPPVSPTFAAQIGRTFRESTQLLADFGKGVVLVAVAAAPWVPVVALVVIPIWLLIRRTWASFRLRRSA